MKLSLRWLAEYVDLRLPPEELAHRLTMAGVEVEAIEKIAGDWDHVVVGRVQALAPHPNADRLRLATVDVGASEPFTVVCGAPNIAVGQAVAFAHEGARLVDARSGSLRVLKRSNIRGVESAGMVCSDRELGISDAHEGIKVLSEAAAVGTPLAAAIGDTIFDFSLTPNRADLFSALGIAREVAALTAGSVREPERGYTVAELPPEGSISVAIEAPDLCPRYVATLVRGVTVAPSPPWLHARLEASGSRPINNVVDITNYVMLEFGQPLHAFDFDKLRGGRIIVRRARADEHVTLIDGSGHALRTDDLVIADAEEAVAVAGVMGDALSEVSDDTSTVLLESAAFNGPSIRRTAAALKLRTEASTRFEKGLTPELALEASRRATRLLVEVCGGTVAGVVDAYPQPRDPVSITLTHERLARVLGSELPPEQVVTPLEALGFTVDLLPDGYAVTAPYWRSDVRIADDVVEEIARIVGYDRLPSAPLQGAVPDPDPQPLRDTGARVRDAFAAAGLVETINYSLVSIDAITSVQALATITDRPPLAVRNPMSEERNVLRTTLRPGLLESFATNRRRQRRAIALFEIGRVFHPRPDDLPHERTFALALLGGVGPKAAVHEGSGPAAALDFFEAKAIAQSVAAALRLVFTYEAAEDPALYTGRAACVLVGGAAIGCIGQIAPAVAARFEIEEPIYLIELDIDALTQVIAERGPLEFTPPSRFPAVVEDLAVVVDEAVPAADVERLIARSRLVERVELFDLYRGAPIPAGKKSLAFSIDYRAPDRTLTDGDVAKARKGVSKRLERELGATIRDA